MTLAFGKNRKLQTFFPFLLSMLLAIPFWILLPDFLPKYRAELVESGFIDKPGRFEYYEDLDHDGFSEKIGLFNAISTISASILNQRPEEANRNLLSLAWLMRSCVGHSNTLSRSLGEELTFVEHYLNLMQSKLESGFEYSLDIAPKVDLSWKVPKMMIQIYAENAVKHGLQPKGERGGLFIAVCCSPFLWG